MSFKTLAALFLIVGISLAQAEQSQDFEKLSIFKNNQYILGLNLSSKMHPEDKKVLNFWDSISPIEAPKKLVSKGRGETLKLCFNQSNLEWSKG